MTREKFPEDRALRPGVDRDLSYSNASEKPWNMAALSEFESRFLNGANRSVNRKVQGSNPCSGANVMSQVLADRCLTYRFQSTGVTFLVTVTPMHT